LSVSSSFACSRLESSVGQGASRMKQRTANSPVVDSWAYAVRNSKRAVTSMLRSKRPRRRSQLTETPKNSTDA
jgi:hypothetical protein